MNYTAEDIEQLADNVRNRVGDYLEDLETLERFAAAYVSLD